MPKDGIASQASEQPKRSGGTITVKNEPGKQSGNKMPHEVMNDKLAKGLGC